MPQKPVSPEAPVLTFASASTWKAWLAKHHATSDGVWVRIFKKGRSTPSVDYAGALDMALCYGWIDSQKKTYDDTSWIQKFTPRRAKSPWSKINIEHAERLIKTRQMRAPGLRQIQAAQTDGRWTQGYDSSRTMSFPDDFLAAVEKDTTIKRNFEALNRTNLYSIAYRLQTAKRPETRARRMQVILAMLKKGERWHP